MKTFLTFFSIVRCIGLGLLLSLSTVATSQDRVESMDEMTKARIDSLMVAALLFSQHNHYEVVAKRSQGFGSRVERWVRNWMFEMDPERTVFMSDDRDSLIKIFRRCIETDINFSQIYSSCLSDADALWELRRFRYFEEARQIIKSNGLDLSNRETLLRSSLLDFAGTLDEYRDRIRKNLEWQFLLRIEGGDSETRAYRALDNWLRNRIGDSGLRSPMDRVRTFVNAFYQSLDPYTELLSAESSEALTMEMRGSFHGIGARVVKNIHDEFEVTEIFPDSPAEKSGLRVNDVLVGYYESPDGAMRRLQGKSFIEIARLIRGKNDQVLQLKVRRLFLEENASYPYAEVLVSINREPVTLDQERARVQLHQVENKKIALITLRKFYKKAAEDIEKLFHHLEESVGPIDGAILDLSGNRGGILQEAIDVAGLFVKRSPVVQTRNLLVSSQGHSRFHSEIYEVSKETLAFAGPLMVKIDPKSSSAAEIVAAFLQDSERAYIVGEQSWGKGSIQSAVAAFSSETLQRIPRISEYISSDHILGLAEDEIIPVTEVSSATIKYTSGKFYRVTGKSTQRDGVVPDLSFYAFNEARALTRSGESHLGNALAPSSIAACKNFQPVADRFTLRMRELTPTLLDKLAKNSGLQLLLKDDELRSERQKRPRILNSELELEERRRDFKLIAESRRKLERIQSQSASRRTDFSFRQELISTDEISSFTDTAIFKASKNSVDPEDLAIQRHDYHRRRLEIDTMLQIMLQGLE